LGLKLFNSQSNTKQAVWVGISSFSSFLVGIASTAIFSRYFEKTDYGTYRQLIFIYTALLSLFSAGIPKAYSYFLPKLSKGQWRQVIKKLTNLFLILGALFSLFLFAASGIIADLLKNPELDHALRLFSVIPILVMPTLGLEGIYTAIRKTHVLAIYTTLTRLGMLVFIVIPVIVFKGTYEMAIYGWMGSSLLVLLLAIYFKYKPFRNEESQSSSVSYREILNYSLPLMVATLAGVGFKTADQFFISRFFGTETFADYANGFIPLPFIPMITGAIHAIFVPLFSKYMEQKEGSILVTKSWKSGVNKAVLLIYPVLIFFTIFAKEVIFIIYGPKYDQSYIYFRLAMILDFSSPFLFYSILLAAGKTRLYAKIHIVFAFIIWSAGFVVCKYGNSALLYVLLSVFLGLMMRWIGLMAAAKSIEVRLIRLIDISDILKIFFIASGIGLISKLAVKWMVDSQVTGFVIGGVIYAGLLLLCDKLLKLNILRTALSVIREETTD
jgi:O-antigen/teichoic acid export membrane protein